MEILAAFILICLATSAASAIHGSDMWVSKGFVMLGYAAVLSAAIYFCLPSDLWAAPIIGVACSLVYWFLFRSGKQARAQIDAIDTIGNRRTVEKPHSEYLKIARNAYFLPVGLSLVAASKAALFSGELWLAALCAPMAFLPYVSSWLCDRYHYDSRRGRKIFERRVAAQREGRKLFWDVRRYTEAGTGLLLSGPCIAVLIVSLTFAWRLLCA